MQGRSLSWLFSTALVTTTTTLFLMFVPALWHWMILPTSIGGILVGVDVVDWLRKRLDVLQPRAVAALFGLHLCYTGPLLHVAWDYWPRFLAPAHDWRTSLGVLALVNMAGLLLYRMVLAVRYRRDLGDNRPLDARRFVAISGAAVSVGLIALVGVMVRFGGPGEYFRIISGRRDALTGSGWLLIVAESWPVIVFAVILVARRAWLRAHLLPLLLLLAMFVVVQFATGGLRGSRGNTVWPTVIAIGLVHLVVTPIRRRALVAASLVIVGFMYVYGFYKAVGTEVLDLANERTTTTTLARETGRTLPLLLLEDFGRAGTQSIVVDRLAHGGELSWGITYVGDLVKLTPDSLIPNPPDDKSSAGTDLLYAPGAYDAGIRSTRIFGLTGEGMLNFGLVGGVLAFLPFALFVRWADRIWRTASTTDSLRLKLLAPGLTAVTVQALGSDFDNVLWLLIAQVLPLALAVVMTRSRSPKLRPAHPR